MKIYLLEQETMVRAGLQEVWTFFSDPGNLERITPRYMDFRILRHPQQAELADGQEIIYRVKPVLGLPVTWVTRIIRVQPGVCFTDIQVKGPYRLWEHTHTFSAAGNGILMKDSIRYALPLGILGRLAHSLFVKKQLRAIFRYREQKIQQLFPGNT